MKHIIVNFHPFQLKQDVLVYSEGKCVEQTSCFVDDIVKVCKGFMAKYDINKVDLWGNEDYLLKYKSQFFNEFDSNQIEITITNKRS